MPPHSRGGRLREAQPGGGIQLTSWIGKNSGKLDRRGMHSPETYLARHFRNNMTETERRLWSRLRSKQIDGYKFRRQVPVGPYFVDFLCISARLAIEVDGPFHEDDADHRKTESLKKAGYRVLRVPVVDVDESLDDVIHGIYLKLSEPSLPIPYRPTRQCLWHCRPPRTAGRQTFTTPPFTSGVLGGSRLPPWDWPGERGCERPPSGLASPASCRLGSPPPPAGCPR